MAERIERSNRTLTRRDLERAGLSRDECCRIERLRERYHPLIEEVESDREWRQLQLLRWLYRQGRYPRG